MESLKPSKKLHGWMGGPWNQKFFYVVKVATFGHKHHHITPQLMHFKRIAKSLIKVSIPTTPYDLPNVTAMGFEPTTT